MIMRNQKSLSVAAAVVITAGVAVWYRSRPVATPRPATFEPGQAVIDESEMSPKAFKDRRRQLVESHRANEERDR